MKIEALPNNIDQLKEIIVNYQKEIEETKSKLTYKIEVLSNRNQELEEKLKLARMYGFGKKSEKWTPEDARQALLFDEAESSLREENKLKEDDQIVRVPVKAYTRKKGRKPIDPKLERKEFVHDLSDDEKKCECCGKSKKKIGEESSEELKFIPAQVEVIRHIYPKYAFDCKCGQKEGQPEVISAHRPVKLLPKTITTSSLLAYLFTGKFEYHLPYHRQNKFFNNLGISISSENMSHWQISCFEKMKSLVELFCSEIKNSLMIGIDETPLQVMLEPGKKNTSKSYMWVFRGGSKDHPLIFFDYQPTRSGEIALNFLRDYKGKIITDGFSGYNFLRAKPSIVAAGCWDHARREFIKAVKLSGKNSRASEVLPLIQELYKIEERLKAEPIDKILEERQKKSKPLIDQIKIWLDDISIKTVPSVQLGKAVFYTLGEWPYLTAFLIDGQIPLSNILVENAIRPFAIGRKNWLFSGSPRGASASAFLFSLVESAKANSLNAYWYLYYLLEKFPQVASDTDLINLMPNRVTQAQLDVFKSAMG